jgi:RNA polymerase sigma-70 factor (ECF subfamily)
VGPSPGPTHNRADSVQAGAGSAQRAQPGGPEQPPRRDLGPPLDARILEGVRERKPEALATFFERYFDHVFSLSFRLLGDRTAAEDLTQEVFLKIHRGAHQLDPSRDPTPWVVAVTYNACRDLWRSRAHRMGRRAASMDDEDTGLASTLSREGDQPEQVVLRGERERLVQQAITALPEPLRTAIVLHDYQGLSHQEIAGITGVNHAAARKRYSRALAALGRLLEDALK